ncbi:MAG: tetratricopeptide repeat protein [Anaerolineae bacterium]|nr:tetratricopeptide repeat protein [Anaerolineae bacterium]
MPNPNLSILGLVERGDSAYKNKEYEEAEQLYTQALELAIQTGTETNYVYSSLVKVYKKAGKYQEAYEISRQAVPTPAGFRDCAICLRQLAKQAKKAEDDALLEETLKELYRLAVLAYLCYGTHDCITGVRGSLHDRAVILCQKLELNQINVAYSTHGHLAGGGLLTEGDYKLFSSFFGETGNSYDPHLNFSALMREVNTEYLKWLRSYFLDPPAESPEFRDSPFWIRMAENNIASTIKELKKIAPFAVND